MLDRRAFLVAASALSVAAVAPAAHAAAPIPFDESAFSAANGEGAPILVAVTAPWCPTCRAQKQVLADLEASGKYAALRVFEVDFDTRKDVLRRFNVQQQSTLITFKGGQEVGRSIGQTGKEAIALQLDKTL
jgi:thioredoxin-like negative regulator of GroEL